MTTAAMAATVATTEPELANCRPEGHPELGKSRPPTSGTIPDDASPRTGRDAQGSLGMHHRAGTDQGQGEEGDRPAYAGGTGERGRLMAILSFPRWVIADGATPHGQQCRSWIAQSRRFRPRKSTSAVSAQAID